jgi:hypothetical protein
MAKRQRYLPGVDYSFDRVMGFVDVLQSPVLQAPGVGIVFLFLYVVMGFVEQLKSFAEAVDALEVGVDRRTVGKVFAVLNGGMLDFADGGVNFIDSMLLLVVNMLVGAYARQVRPGIAEVVECMQISGVPAGFVGPGGVGERGQEHEQHQGKPAESFH